jgi:hypothetical protein
MPTFNLKEFSPAVRAAFENVPVLWPTAVDAAIKDGITNPDKLADIAFFMLHKDRLENGIGKPLHPSEPEFESLAAQWAGFHALVIPMIEPHPVRSEQAWDLTEDERISMRKLSGKALVNWAAEAPQEKAESASFPAKRKAIQEILAWKSRNPRSVCLANPRQQVQLMLLPNERVAFWKRRFPEGNTAEITADTWASHNRAYRQHILRDKICPKGAEQKELGINEELTLIMAAGLFAIMPIPGVGGNGKTFDSVKKLIEAFISTIQD